MKNNSLNLADYISWWKSGAGDVKAGSFNESLYLKFLTYYNNRNGK